MKKLAFSWCLILLIVPIVFAQDKIDAPVWNVGDKWIFTQGNIEVVGADQNSYTLNFSKDTCILENKTFEKIIFDKSSLNRIYAIKAEKREKYTIGHRRVLNFPITLGKEWKDKFTTTTLIGPNKGKIFDYAETFKVLGWEDVQLQAGKFKAIKLKYFQVCRSTGGEGEDFYWYAPEVKYFLKCQYDRFYRHGIANWELVSFIIKK